MGLEADVELVLVVCRVLLLLMRADDCGSGGWNDGGGCVASPKPGKREGGVLIS